MRGLSLRTLAVSVCACVLAVAALKGVWDIGARLVFEWQVPYTGDVHYFMTIGRGLLNGLLPYVDLFETKPPGIFWLSALSLWLTGDMTLTHIAQIAVLVVLPIAIIVSAWSFARQEVALFVCTVLFAITITLYTAVAAGTLYPESFGAFFAVLYACLLHIRGDRWGWMETAGAAACIVGSVLMKEPFGLSIVMVALLLVHEPRRLFARLIVPLACALGVELIVFTLLGYTGGYFGFYLPFMGSPYFESPMGPVWLQGFYWYRLVVSLVTVSPLLPVALGALAVFPIACALGGRASRVLWITLIVAIGLTFAPIYVASGSFRPIVLLAMLAGIGVSLWMIVRRDLQDHDWVAASRLPLLLCTVYVLVLLPGTRGQFLSHHGVFSVPLYTALLFVTLRSLAESWQLRVVRISAWGWAGLFAATLIFYVSPTHATLVAAGTKEEANMRDAAGRIDAVMDACAIDRYLLLGPIDTGIPAYTLHSPLGPGFNQEKFNILVPQFRDRYVENIRTARLVVVQQPVLMPGEAQAAMRSYVTTPPSCADGLPAPEGTKFYFRVGDTFGRD